MSSFFIKINLYFIQFNLNNYGLKLSTDKFLSFQSKVQSEAESSEQVEGFLFKHFFQFVKSFWNLIFKTTNILTF